MRVPGTTWRPLSESGTQPAIRPTQIIIHTAVDAPGPTSLYGYFENSTSLESHLFIRWDRTEQYVDTEVRADANYRANRRADGTGAISVETEDDGSPVQNPWNAFQLDELVRIIMILCREHDIPARLCRTPDDPGLGWHAMFGSPSAWTNVSGKTCPGSTRIQQFKTIVLPRVQAALAATPTPTPAPSEEDDDMPSTLWAFKGLPHVYVVPPHGAFRTWVPNPAALEWGQALMRLGGHDDTVHYVEPGTSGWAWLEGLPEMREVHGLTAIVRAVVEALPVVAPASGLAPLDDATIGKIAKAVNDDLHRRTAA